MTAHSLTGRDGGDDHPLIHQHSGRRVTFGGADASAALPATKQIKDKRVRINCCHLMDPLAT